MRKEDSLKGDLHYLRLCAPGFGRELYISLAIVTGLRARCAGRFPN